MNATEQVNRSRQQMGGSGSSNPLYYSSSKSLNYAGGSNSITTASATRMSAIPQVLNFKDSVGLFGAENIFIKFDLEILNAVTNISVDQTPVNSYFPAFKDDADEDTDFYWDAAVMDFSLDLFTVNEYEPAVIDTKLETILRPLISIDLANLKTGNKYIDAWFDVRLYTKNREEHPYDKMYIPTDSFFYVGFHARNTKRLPYNVRMTVGETFISEFDLPKADRRYLVS